MRRDLSNRLIYRLQQASNAGKKKQITANVGLVQASVMLILREERDTQLLFIKRSENANDPFSGHMAFPGGKMKEGDVDKLETAYRETLEEVGIDLKKNGRVMGELDDIRPNNPRARHLIVTPFICKLINSSELRPNGEVSEAIWIKLSNFSCGKNTEVKEKDNLITERVYKYKDYVIWGMTAKILYNLLTLTELDN